MTERKPVHSNKSETLISAQNAWKDLVTNLQVLLNDFNANRPDHSKVTYESALRSDLFVSLRRVCCGPLCFQLKLSCSYDPSDQVINVHSDIDLLPGSLAWLSSDDVQNSLQACRSKHAALSVSLYELQFEERIKESVIVPRSDGVLRRTKLTAQETAREILTAFLSE